MDCAPTQKKRLMACRAYTQPLPKAMHERGKQTLAMKREPNRPQPLHFVPRNDPGALMITTMILNRFLSDSAKYLGIAPAGRRMRAGSVALCGTYGRIARTWKGRLAMTTSR
jgi:hypothetical protein